MKYVVEHVATSRITRMPRKLKKICKKNGITWAYRLGKTYF